MFYMIRQNKVNLRNANITSDTLIEATITPRHSIILNKESIQPECCYYMLSAMGFLVQLGLLP